RRRKCEVPALYTRVLRKVLAGVLMGKDRCAGRVQPFIPVRVVEVPVRVDEVFDGVGANARRSVGNLRPGSCKTGVDEKLTVATGEDGDVAPGTHQDAYIAPKSLYRNRGTRRLFSRLLYEAGGRHRIRAGEDTM